MDHGKVDIPPSFLLYSPLLIKYNSCMHAFILHKENSANCMKFQHHLILGLIDIKSLINII